VASSDDDTELEHVIDRYVADGVRINPAFGRTGKLPAGQPLYVKMSPREVHAHGIIDPRHPDRFQKPYDVEA